MNSKVVVFDIKSKLAHFRKINSNSSSLTYIVPPRTTILGIIAGILGRERDSYYTDKDFEEMKIGVEPICPHRVMTQTINYLFVESFNMMLQDIEIGRRFQLSFSLQEMTLLLEYTYLVMIICCQK